MPLRGDLTLALAIGIAFAVGWPTVSVEEACTSNPIVCENQLPGNPVSEWDISGSGDQSLQGFATDISINKGETVRFKVDTTAARFNIGIYRLGYYGGLGARKIASIADVSGTDQPACLTQASTGLVDCGNWLESAAWAVPATAVSGVYIARLTRPDTGGASHVVFIVRDDQAQAAMLFQTSDTTWHAYNGYGGNSLYWGGPGTNPGRAYKVSYNRPFSTRGLNPEDWLFNAEYPMIRWLEANGYDVSYITGVDTDRYGASELQRHRVFLSVGHDEYWSGAQRAHVEAARAAGVNLAFFSGNEAFWKTRWESSIDGTATPYRTLVCYKETHANARLDPLDPPIWTGTWRDPRFSPPADGGRPENALTGTIFTAECCNLDAAIKVPQVFASQPFWRNTRVATLPPGGTATLTAGTLGYEFDENLNNGFRPAGLITLSSTVVSMDYYLKDYGSTYGQGTATHELTMYFHPSGALVFGAGTCQWSWGLDSMHDRGSAPADLAVQQATVNLFSDMGVAAGSLQPGLVSGTPSSDTQAPTSAITSPAPGASVQSGTLVTIAGTASDAGGGSIIRVEVSTDGGATWQPASGSTTWTYAWTPSAAGTAALKSRATDTSNNRETPSAGIAVTVSGPVGTTCPCSLWNTSTTPGALVPDPNAVELGVKFRADSDGYIGAVRFYKYAQNTGTHTGHLWTTSGTSLGTVAFTNETASGWQQASFSTPVSITAGTTYVASYFTPTGYYAATEPGFATAVDNPPLHALADGTAGGNGVYRYGATSGFPDQTYASSNYWVDVVFTPLPVADTTPPTVTTVSPSPGATNIPATTSVTVAFSEPADPATVSGTTVTLRDSGQTLVPATVTLSGAVATLTPAGPLASGATYAVSVTGGANGVKDLAGNALAATVTSSFTTAPLVCPCSIWNLTTVPGPVIADPSASELGVKFVADSDGFITGLRFYKYAENVGTHVGHLWTASGTLLGTATFTNETATGWQQGTFATPVPISGGTTYVASYFTPSGYYAATEPGFATAVDNPPLHVLADGTAAGNGVYRYGATSGFPDQTYLASNYWVDVVFTLSSPSVDSEPPAVAIIAPANGVTVQGTAVAVSATATDNVAVAGVQFVLDGAHLGAEVPAAPFTLSWNTTGASNGTHSLTAVARDSSGNSATSAPITVTVSNAATQTLSIDRIAYRDSSSRSSSITTSAFSTTASNELLLAFVAADETTLTGQRVTAVTGAGLTWQLVIRSNANRGSAEIWRAFATSLLTNVSVRATLAQATAASLTVMSFKGADATGTAGSGAIGAVGSSSAASGAPTATLVTSRNGSWVIGVGNDWDGSTSRTLGPGQTLVHEYLATVGDTFWVQRTTQPTALSGTSVTINDTAPTGDRYNLSICEILPAAQP